MKYLNLFENFEKNDADEMDFLITVFKDKLEYLIKNYFDSKHTIKLIETKSNAIDFNLFHRERSSELMIRIYVSFEVDFFNLRVNNYSKYLDNPGDDIIAKINNMCEYLEIKIESLASDVEKMGSFYELSPNNFRILISNLEPDIALDEIDLIGDIKKYNL